MHSPGNLYDSGGRDLSILLTYASGFVLGVCLSTYIIYENRGFKMPFLFAMRV